MKVCEFVEVNLRNQLSDFKNYFTRRMLRYHPDFISQLTVRFFGFQIHYRRTLKSLEISFLIIPYECSLSRDVLFFTVEHIIIKIAY